MVEGKPEDGDEDARAAQLVWKIIDGDVGKPFVSSGLEFVPLPVFRSLVLDNLIFLYLKQTFCMKWEEVFAKTILLCMSVSMLSRESVLEGLY